MKNKKSGEQEEANKTIFGYNFFLFIVIFTVSHTILLLDWNSKNKNKPENEIKKNLT